MKRVAFVHWNLGEARQRAKRIESAGYEVDASLPDSPAGLKRLIARAPDAIVIDLARLPSQGRDVGIALRQAKKTRSVPLIFVGGEAAKVERTRSLLPDAAFTDWRRIRGTLSRVLARPPADPVAPAGRLAGYSGTPLAKKLGMKPDTVVVLVGAPLHFAETIPDLPARIVFRSRAQGPCGLALWFVTSRRKLESRIVKMAALAHGGGLWIVWPKKASGVESDLSEKVVRETGLANGLVDYKICAVDATWSGLKFALRKRGAELGH